MKAYKTLMALGLAGLLSVIPSFVSAKQKQKITRDYAAKYLNVSQNFLKSSLGYHMHISTYDNILLSTCVGTDYVNVVSEGNTCRLEGRVSAIENQALLKKKFEYVDIEEPKFIITRDEELKSRREICAEYKQEQEKIASSQKKQETVVESIKEEQKKYTFSGTLGKVSVEEAVKSAFVSSLQVTPWKDNKGCNYQYDKKEFIQIDQATLDNFLGILDKDGDLNITSKEIVPHLQELCKQAILKNGAIEEQDIKN